MTDPLAWMDDGECLRLARERGEELGDELLGIEEVERYFFPGRSDGPSVTAAGKRICARCPVNYECGEFALQIGVKHGLWGGLAPKERRRERRARGMVNKKMARAKKTGYDLPPVLPDYQLAACPDCGQLAMPTGDEWLVGWMRLVCEVCGGESELSFSEGEWGVG